MPLSPATEPTVKVGNAEYLNQFLPGRGRLAVPETLNI